MEVLNHILLIDADDASNLITRIMLKKASVAEHIHTTRNGEEAITLLSHTNIVFPDLILLEINMPVMDGFEFLAYWKKNNFIGKSRIVIYTYSARTEDISYMCQYKDVVGYLEKPINNTQITKLINLVHNHSNYTQDSNTDIQRIYL
ncbi:response regulator [Cytophagaceae bacterium DM2B3-1]|uniref:Response regulator n=1 Tax=Xanthocytophaga flava TaxID=3048013 RepID=A0ABT7CSJ5_9BACT|nr:response regulator [Xanthocytophaga flavus]MDJ1496709.1 response regulator [Xanthocytophaga flavus]